MGRSLIMTALLLTTALMGARYAVAGQAPFAASDPDIPLSHQDRVSPAETVLEHGFRHRSRRQQAPWHGNAKQSDLVGPECRRLSQKRSKRRADVQAILSHQ